MEQEEQEQPELEQDSNELNTELGLDELGTPGEVDVIESLKQGGNVVIDKDSQETISFETPQGFKLHLSSSKLTIENLCGLALQVMRELKEPAQNGKGAYVG